MLANQGGDGSHECLCVFHPWFYLCRLDRLLTPACLEDDRPWSSNKAETAWKHA